MLQLIGHSGLVVRTLDSYLVEECKFELFGCHFKGWMILCVDYDYVECSGSGVELWTLDKENPGSNPGCGVKTLDRFFHSTLLQFTQLYK